jgi:hypothetical protein
MEGVRMGASTRVVLLALFATACLLVPAGQALADASCDHVSAKGEGEQHDGGRITADLNGGGALSGSGKADLKTTGVHGSDLSFEGDVKIDTDNGSLEASIEGTLDLRSGKFSASGPVTDSSGELSGAKGDLDIQGVENLAERSLKVEVKTEICGDEKT